MSKLNYIRNLGARAKKASQDLFILSEKKKTWTSGPAALS